jgi:hypothetical protein
VYPECECGALWKACNLQIRPPLSVSEDAQVRYMKQPSDRDKVLDCIVLPRLKKVTKGKRLLDSWLIQTVSHLHRHILFNGTVITPRLPLWSSAQNSCLQIRRYHVSFPIPSDFLRSIGVWNGVHSAL